MRRKWIKQWRKTLDNEIFWKDKTAWHVFEVLLLSVDRTTGVYTYGRDQLGWMTKLHPETARSAVIRLKTARMVTTTSTNKFTTLTIVNWHKYQDTTPAPTPDISPTNHQQITTKQEYRSKEYTADFLKFWEAYPKKESKLKASDSFRQVVLNEQTFGAVMSGLQKHKQSKQWQKDNGQFIPYAATWLNQRRWEDELTTGGRYF